MSEHRSKHKDERHNHKEHDSAHGHSHGHSHSGKQRLRVKSKDTPGVIYIEQRTHDEAIVVSGSLTVGIGAEDLNAWLAEELEAAASKVGECDGIVGHIKVALSVTSTSMISVTDEKAMIKDSPQKRAKMTLAAIVFKIDPEVAE